MLVIGIDRGTVRRVRVAFDVTPLLGTRSGVAVVVGGLLEALTAMDEPPEIVPWTMSGRDRSGGGLGAVNLLLPAAVAVPLWRHFGRPRVDRRLGRPDVVHGTNYVVPPSRGRSVVSVYDLSFVHESESTSRSVRRFDSTVRSAVKRGAVIHTTSEWVAGELRDRYRARVEVIMPGIAPGEQRATPSGPPYIAAVGTAVKRKCFPLLIEAFAMLAEQRPEVELVMAGAPGPDSDAITAALAALPTGVAPRAKHLGRIDDADRDRLLRGAVVLAHPSRYEGFGLPILEAMNVGVPVVLADAGAAPEVAGNAGVVVPPGDAVALAAGLTSILDSEELAADLARRGLGRSAVFDWATAAAKMSGLYRRLVDEDG